MHVWLSDAGELLLFQRNQRLWRSGELARHLVASGHKVTWWVSDFSHRLKKFIGEPGTKRTWEGIDMEFIHGTGYRRNVGIERLIHVEVHARNLRRAIEKRPPPDIIVSGMPMIEASDVLTRYGKQHGVPVVVDVRDEWPEDYVRWLPPSLRPLGRLALLPKFRQLRRACRSATAIVGVTERQLQYGLRHAGRPRSDLDAVIYNSVSEDDIDPERLAAVEAEWRAALCQSSELICVFTGTMSPSRPLGPVIEAVKRLSKELPVKLVIAGNGDLEETYRAQAGDSPGVQFVGWLPPERLQGLQRAADVLVAAYDPSFGFSMPTKLFEYMVAGKPIVSSCPGEAWDLVESADIGINYRFDDPASVARALRMLWQDKERQIAMGENARRLFDSQFRMDRVMGRYRTYLESLAGKASPSRTSGAPPG